MKLLSIIIIILCGVFTAKSANSIPLDTAQSQTNPPPTFIKGTMDIKFTTRIQNSGGIPNKGVVDTYNLNMNISNSAIFQGTITFLPVIQGSVYGISQYASLNYDIKCGVVNPNPPHQSRMAGKLFGTVPIDANGLYKFAEGNLTIATEDMGTAKGFQSKFSGFAQGKPLIPRSKSWWDSLKQETLSITKNVNGKSVNIAVKKYDKMSFRNHILARGPIGVYPEATVLGDVVYDYSRNVWFFQNVSINYPLAGRMMFDKLSGNIKWIESPDREKNGEGQYEFDIRVNEPVPAENAAFADAADESDFFKVDDTIPSLTGLMKYKDLMVNGTVTASNVQVDLRGNRLNKQQCMNLFKLIFFTSIVPFNAE